MVRLSITLFATSLILGSFATPLKRDVATIESDIMNITTQVTALDDAVTAFPVSGGSLVGALTYVYSRAPSFPRTYPLHLTT